MPAGVPPSGESPRSGTRPRSAPVWPSTSSVPLVPCHNAQPWCAMAWWRQPHAREERRVLIPLCRDARRRRPPATIDRRAPHQHHADGRKVLDGFGRVCVCVCGFWMLASVAVFGLCACASVGWGWWVFGWCARLNDRIGIGVRCGICEFLNIFNADSWLLLLIFRLTSLSIYIK